MTITLHLRPPHHPGRRVRAVPQARPRPAARARTTSTSRSSARSACPTRPSSGGATTTRSTTSSRCSRSRSTCRRSSTCTGCGATSSPTSTRWRGKSRTCTASSTRPPTASPSGTSTASSSPTTSPARTRMPLGEILARAPRRLLPHDRHRVHAHPGARGEAWIQQQVEGVDPTVEPEEQRHILDRLNAAEAFEKFLGTKYLGQKRFGIEGAESAIPLARRHPRARRPTTASTRRCSAWPTAAGSTCWPTSSASPTTSCSRSSRATSTPTPSRARAT